SVALGGALSLGASVPADHLTDCAAPGPACATTRPAAAVMDSVVSTSRRVQSVGIVAPSLVGRVRAARLAEKSAGPEGPHTGYARWRSSGRSGGSDRRRGRGA